MAQSLTERLPALQKETKNIRNICIMAHVDHGKTTLADSLIASNGIISHRMSGKLRYMDSRRDEQERGITMKSSSIALQYRQCEFDYLVNLIDSPGHVDFSGEVSSAIQLCDGALILIDVVEGVCAQTIVSIRQAWLNGIKMILVLNKIDRLIIEIKMSPIDAYARLQRILEQINAIVGELFNADVLVKTSEISEAAAQNGINSTSSGSQIYDWSSGLDDSDDSNLYFTPDQGNVVFASGLDGWGFRIQHFAELYSQKLGVNKEILHKTLWGDFYLNNKTKRIMKGAQNKAKKCLFVQFVLENLWSVYETIILNKDKEKLEKIVKALNLKIPQRDLNHSDPKVQLQAVFYRWLPLAPIILEAVCDKLPSPLDITEDRAMKLICCKGQRFDTLLEETQQLKTALCKCSASYDDPVIVYVSKMIAVEQSCLPSKKLRPLTDEDLAKRREIAREKHLAKMLNKTEELTKEVAKDEANLEEDEPVFIAFARIFSGVLRKGQKLYVLGPKHDPTETLTFISQGGNIDPSLTVETLKSNEHITIATIEDLYVLMGRELESLEEVPAGNILGIGQLACHVIKHATLSTTVACPSLGVKSIHTIPIMRVAVEPQHSSDMPNLTRGLKLLNQADACVRVLIQETGEHVIVTAGEVHLQRCLDDLRERFAKVKVNVSPPIVPFRETVVLPPKIDMVNEKIIGDKNQLKMNEDCRGILEAKTSNKQASLKLRACPLPESVVTLLEENQEIIKIFENFRSMLNRNIGKNMLNELLDESTINEVKKFKSSLEKCFSEAGSEWQNAINEIWGFGPHRSGPNILLCKIPQSNYARSSYWVCLDEDTTVKYQLSEIDSCVVSGFQLATNSGPMCEEPMRGTCFVVEDLITELRDNDDESGCCDNSDKASSKKETASENFTNPYGPFSGQLISLMRELCRRAFQAQPQRLMTAMYSCNIQVTAEVLGEANWLNERRALHYSESALHRFSLVKLILNA